eukprot:scaffold31801_cov70-Attheya_sp.AAC.2
MTKSGSDDVLQSLNRSWKYDPSLTVVCLSLTPWVAYRIVWKSGIRKERTATRSGQRKPRPCKLSGINANSRAYSGMASSCVAWPMMFRVVILTTLVRSDDHSRLLSGRASLSTCARMSAVSWKGTRRAMMLSLYIWVAVWGSGNSLQSVFVSSANVAVNFVRNDVWKGLLPKGMPRTKPHS